MPQTDPHPRRALRLVKRRPAHRRLMSLAPNDYYRPAEIAAYLRLAPGTLANWRCKGGGPPFVKEGNKVLRYRGIDVLEWLAARRRRTTADTPALRVVTGEVRRG